MGKVCTRCGNRFNNGEAYYVFEDEELCEPCLTLCERIFDEDEYENEPDYDFIRKERLEREISDDY